MKHVSSILLIIVISLVSCTKSGSSYTPPPPPDTQLKLTLTDMVTGLPAAGATVNLYMTLADWQSGSGAVATQTADFSGVVTFTHLTSYKYYWYASFGCRNNWFQGSTTTGPLPAGATTSLAIGLSSTGTLKFTNNFADPCRVDVNGMTMITAMPGNSIYTIKLGTGFYDVRAVRLSGGFYDQTFTGQLTCGGTLTTVFP